MVCYWKIYHFFLKHTFEFSIMNVTLISSICTCLHPWETSGNQLKILDCHKSHLKRLAQSRTKLIKKLNLIIWKRKSQKIYVSKGPKSSTKIDTVPVNKTRMSIPDVTHRRGRRNLGKTRWFGLMNSTKNRLVAPRSCSSRLVTGMQIILKNHWKVSW